MSKLKNSIRNKGIDFTLEIVRLYLSNLIKLKSEELNFH